MSCIICDAPQGSDAWHASRLGRYTGSSADDLSDTHAIRLALERITEKPVGEEFSNADTKRGNELEPYARMRYEAKTGEIVNEAGFAYLPTIMAGCSVDGFVGDDGIVEIKCPRTMTHVAYLLANEIPKQYVAQILHNLWVTGRKWCDFVSYDNTLPLRLQLFVKRFVPSPSMIATHEATALRFLFKVKDYEDQLRGRME